MNGHFSGLGDRQVAEYFVEHGLEERGSIPDTSGISVFPIMFRLGPNQTLIQWTVWTLVHGVKAPRARSCRGIKTWSLAPHAHYTPSWFHA